MHGYEPAASGNSIDWTPAVSRLVDLLREEPRLAVSAGMEERVAVRLLFGMLPTLTPLIRDGLREASGRSSPGPVTSRSTGDDRFSTTV
jgi:hypothetical protein